MSGGFQLDHVGFERDLRPAMYDLVFNAFTYGKVCEVDMGVRVAEADDLELEDLQPALPILAIFTGEVLQDYPPLLAPFALLDQ